MVRAQQAGRAHVSCALHALHQALKPGLLGQLWAGSSVGRARPLHGWGQRFDPVPAHQIHWLNLSYAEAIGARELCVVGLALEMPFGRCF